MNEPPHVWPASRFVPSEGETLADSKVFFHFHHDNMDGRTGIPVAKMDLPVELPLLAVVEMAETKDGETIGYRFRPRNPKDASALPSMLRVGRMKKNEKLVLATDILPLEGLQVFRGSEFSLVVSLKATRLRATLDRMF